MNNNFSEKEIVTFERFNKKLGKNVVVQFPVVGGRLRMFHEDLSGIGRGRGGISTDIVKYESDIAVVKATLNINENVFTGVGMASKSRDAKIWPAILELAETRAIARALRFAGYGVEYTGAEEMQHVKNFGEDIDVTSSEDEKYQGVNDDVKHDEKPSVPTDEPSLKRQVWNLITSSFPNVQENYLAGATLEFVGDTMAKYDDGNADTVYRAVLLNPDRFKKAFEAYIKRNVPEIKSPGIEPEMPLDQEDQDALDSLKKEVVGKMTIDPPPPVIDNDKIMKANIYREMPDGVNVSALNGTLKTLIAENPKHTPGEIYAFVLDDISGFMTILTGWCAKHEMATGLEPKTADKVKVPEKKEEKPAGLTSPLAFRKSWVRLDWENFGKFIIENSETFKNDKEEYDLAVAKFDRLKTKSGAPDMKFPYLFSQAEIKVEPKLSTEKSVIGDTEGEVGISHGYIRYFPILSKSIMDADPDLRAEDFNERVENYMTTYETENQKPYFEEVGI